MEQDAGIFVGAGQSALYLLPRMTNRHGMIAGATGTGKTVTARVIAEGLSHLGVPVFISDVKGDLAGLARPVPMHPKLEERAKKIGLEGYHPAAAPVVFWDLYGEQGHPIRSTVSEMGPLLLGRLLDLNATQDAILHLVFKVADDNGLLLLDIDDLRSMLNWVGENAKQISIQYGGVSTASIAAIQRGLLVLEQEGAGRFFGEPALELTDFMRTDLTGRGIVNVLAADKLMTNPKLYATALLWLLSELFEELPEVGDVDRPKLVLFFDEAHLLFEDAPEALIDKIEQVVRLVRSKGVGLFFVSQSPLDVPDQVLGQLGNRVQHALRAFTPRDQKAVKAAAQTFRVNPKLDTVEAITQLGVGEALVSLLDAKGIPTMVERTLIRPPETQMGAITPEERAAVIKASPIGGRYDVAVNRESAQEILARRTAEKAAAAAQAAETEAAAKAEAAAERTASRKTSRGRGRQSVGETLAKSVARTVGSAVGRQIVRGILGAILKG